MRYCTKCLYGENHPLGITFDQDGVCSGCQVHEEKQTLDWTARRKKLQKILDGYKNRGASNYDCVIPISGARDSFYIVHTIKKEFGLNPLLVSYNRHYNTRHGLDNIQYLRHQLDCDIVTLTVGPEVIRKVSRAAFMHHGSFHWTAIAGQTVYPVRVAVGYKIPLIIWGAHQGLDQVGMYSHQDEIEMTRRYRHEHDLLCTEPEQLVDTGGLTEEDLSPFFYPNDKEIEQVGVRGIYLGNYIAWDSWKQHQEMQKLYQYNTHALSRTFDIYNDIDCQHYNGAHDYIKYRKFGYGKVHDQLCREIRWGRITREQALSYLNSLDLNQEPEDLGTLLDWLDLDKALFEKTMKTFSKEPWSLNNDDQSKEENLPFDLKHAAPPFHSEEGLLTQGRTTLFR